MSFRKTSSLIFKEVSRLPNSSTSMTLLQSAFISVSRQSRARGIAFNAVIAVCLHLLSNVLLPSVSLAQPRPELFYSDSKIQNNKLSMDAELSLEVQQDQLRQTNNPNRTNIRNLSLGFNFKEDNNVFRFELLGEQSQLSNDINMNVGEFYLTSEINDSYIPTKVFAGAVKLDYGILNDLDGVLSYLPSYYSVLYDLPRGIDSGLGLQTLFLDEKLSFSSFVFLGRNLRQEDAQNQRLDVAPHHFKLTWNESDIKISANYFSRKYEGQALIQGVGLELSGLEYSLFKSWLKLNLSAEVFSLRTSLNGLNTQGVAGLIHPELEIKSVLFRSVLAMEQWSQSNQTSTETYSTLGLGYKFTKNIHAYFERSEIANTTNALVKEQSYQFRLVSQWML